MNIPQDPKRPSGPATEELPRPVEALLPEPGDKPEFERAMKDIPLSELERILAEALGRRMGRTLHANLLKLEFDFSRGATFTVSVKEPMDVDFSF